MQLGKEWAEAYRAGRIRAIAWEKRPMPASHQYAAPKVSPELEAGRSIVLAMSARERKIADTIASQATARATEARLRADIARTMLKTEAEKFRPIAQSVSRILAAADKAETAVILAADAYGWCLMV